MCDEPVSFPRYSLWLGPILFLFLLFPSLSCLADSVIPSLEGNAGWLGPNGPNKPPDLSGKVVLFDFWDYTCINCIRTFPHLNTLYKKYSPKGLVIVAIHSPEFSFAGDPARIEDAIRQYHLRFPVVMDNNLILWKRFHNHYWPSDYLYDPSGHLVYHAIGEGSYDLLENQVRVALHLPTSALSADQTDFRTDLTPELYAGFDRGQLGNPSGYHPGGEALYTGHPSHLSQITLHGKWKTEADHITPLPIGTSTPSSLTVLYYGKGVNAVLKRTDRTLSPPVMVLLDGTPVPRKYFGRDLGPFSHRATGLNIKTARMYSLISGQQYGLHRIDLLFPSPGSEVYTLTFNP